MTTIRPLSLLTVALLTLTGCAGGPSSTADDAPPLRPASYDTFSRSDNNRVVVHGNSELQIYEVYSFNGIGSASIILTKGDWPRAAVVRLHTRLLEQFRIETPEPKKMSTGLSVSSYGDHSVRHEPPREAGDPLLLSLKIVDRRLPPFEPKLPIVDDDGYFEITVPDAMLRANPEYLKFSWVDVYRR